MTTTTPLPFRIEQPDRLIKTIRIKLPDEQLEYLKANKEISRPELYKAFKKRFNSKINKLQFNFNLERAKGNVGERVPREELASKKRYPRPKLPKAENVQWISQQGIWQVSFTIKGKRKSFGRYADHDKAVQVAEEYRKNLA